MNKLELTNKGKIILGVVAVFIIVLIIVLIVMNGGKDVERISIEMVYPNEGIVVDDPILGTSTQLKVGKKIKLASTILPDNHKRVSTMYVVEDENIAYVDEDNNLVGKSEGTTKVYMTTKDNKIKSNSIEVTITK